MEHATPSPSVHLEPTEVATDTFVVHAHCGDDSGIVVPVNVLVLRSTRPVVVDTGMAEHRDQLLADVFTLVDPEDIGWIVISHDDVDHTGNVNALMRAAPNAILVTDWLMRHRMGASLDVSPLRQRWIAPGDRIDVGDRVLSAIRPPVYDSPATRGVFDPTTGVYWSADSFGTPLDAPVPDVGGLDPVDWEIGMATFDRFTAPWITMADDRRFQASVDVIEGLGASVIAGSHTPVISRHHVHTALAAARRSPAATAAPHPDQRLLDQIRTHLAE